MKPLILILTAFPLLAQDPATEALDSVRALRSVTSSGISYREYAPRVLDARVKVDRFLDQAPEPARPAIQAAMHGFEIAAAVWNRNLRQDDPVNPMTMRQMLADPQIAACPLIQEKAKRWRSYLHAPYPPEVLSKLWACADAQITLAENASK